MPAFFMPICTFVPFSYLLYNKNESEVFSLKKQKYYINLTDQEADLKPDPNFDISPSSVRQFFSTPNTAFCAKNRHL